MTTRKISPAAQVARIISTMTVVELHKLTQELSIDGSLYTLAMLVEKYEDEFSSDGKWRVVLPVIDYWNYLPRVIEPAEEDGQADQTYTASAIRYIKAIRETLGISLYDAKQIVDKASTQESGKIKKLSTVFESESESEAQRVFELLVARGLQVELK